MPEYRQDPVTGRWVIVASERAKRPHHHARNIEAVPALTCPFCAGNEAMTPPETWALRENHTHANAPGWRVRVVPNKYPALEDRSESNPDESDEYQRRSALGVHEVIIESPNHVISMEALNVEQIADVLNAYRERMRDLRSDPRWRYLLIYKNQGERAGATLEHVHSQLVALPAVPRQARDEIEGGKRHFDTAGRCIYCDITERESNRGARLVADSERFIALCPFAPRFAYETWLLPKHHAAAFEETSDEDILALALSIKDLFGRLERALNHPPFNYLLHSAPPREPVAEYYHWHVEILPQMTMAAGFEWGSGEHINPVTPEDAARLLRDAAL